MPFRSAHSLTRSHHSNVDCAPKHLHMQQPEARLGDDSNCKHVQSTFVVCWGFEQMNTFHTGYLCIAARRNGSSTIAIVCISDNLAQNQLASNVSVVILLFTNHMQRESAQRNTNLSCLFTWCVFYRVHVHSPCIFRSYSDACAANFLFTRR